MSRIKFDGKPYDLSTMDDNGLLKLKEGLDGEIARIADQLETAKAEVHLTGTYADPDWFRRATAAKRFFGRDSQRIQNELSRRRAVRRTERSLADYFMDVVKEEVELSDFQEMLDIAQQRRRAAQDDQEGNR